MSQKSSFLTKLAETNKFVLVSLFLLMALFLVQIAKAQFSPEDYILPEVAATEEVVNIEAALPTNVSTTPPPVIFFSELYTASNWHADVPVFISWDLTDDIEAVAVALTNDSGFEPRYESQYVHTPPTSEFGVDTNSLVNGTQYINIQFMDSSGWGDLVSLPVNIDFTPPEPFMTQVIYGDKNYNYEPILRFQTVDKHSGLAGYKIEVYNGDPETSSSIISSEASEADGIKGMILEGLESKKPYVVRIYAIDNVGNQTISDTYITVPGFRDLYTAFKQVFNPYNVLIYGLLLLVLLEFLYLHRQRRFYVDREQKLIKETKEINTQSIRVFEALREDVSEQITLMKKKTRMPKQEIIDNLTQSLEVSEMLLDKEVADVEKLLKEKPKHR